MNSLQPLVCWASVVGFELAVCFKLDSPVVPDLCLLLPALCVPCPSHALRNAYKCHLLLLLQGARAQL